jgi:hypothetical protein
MNYLYALGALAIIALALLIPPAAGKRRAKHAVIRDGDLLRATRRKPRV